MDGNAKDTFDDGGVFDEYKPGKLRKFQRG
jgi:hypothetical protein